MRHLNIILKVGFERGNIFVFFKHFWPKWPALWAKRPLQACMPGLSLRERLVSRPFPHGDGLLLVTPVSDLWPEYARSGTRLRTSALLRSWQKGDLYLTSSFQRLVDGFCVCVCNAFESWAVQLTVHSSFIINNGAMPMPDRKNCNKKGNKSP